MAARVARHRADRAARLRALGERARELRAALVGDVIVGLDHREARLAREALGALAREQHVAAVAQHRERGVDRVRDPRHADHAARAPRAALHHRGVERDAAVAVEHAAAPRVEHLAALELAHRGDHRVERAAARVEQVAAGGERGAQPLGGALRRRPDPRARARRRRAPRWPARSKLGRPFPHLGAGSSARSSETTPAGPARRAA